jgi:hypothetical protein
LPWPLMAGAFLRSWPDPEGSKVMCDNVIHCPVFGTPVPTGLRTDTIRFASLPDIPFRLQCPACRMVHRWRPKDAWIRKDDKD